MGWHPTFANGTLGKDQAGERKGWTEYSWNKLLFPQPKEFLDHIHAEGIKATLNMHPAGGVEPWEDAYPAMAHAMGIDPATQKYVPFELADKKFATNYMDILHHPLEKQGIDFWWLDWQQSKTLPIPNLSMTWWLNYVHFTDQQREGKRPLLFHRWGGLGNHRYQIGFSGDVISSWESAGLPAMVYGNCGKRWLCLLEPRHRRTHSRPDFAGDLHALDTVRRLQPDSAHPHYKPSRC